MNGAGNDFIVIDNRFYFFAPSELSALAAKMCPRRTGIGADGLLALEAAPVDEESAGEGMPGVDFVMRYFNADGSVGSMCGNGARCLARYARTAGFESEPLVFETGAGRYSASVPSAEGASVRLNLPAHRDLRRCHPGGEGQGEETWFVWTGTEHAVTWVDEVAAAPVAERGPVLRRDPAFADAGANVNFVEIAGTDRIRVRTFEKGVEEETLACGTGATASALVARVTGRVSGDRIGVDMPGGRLTVGLRTRESSIEPDYLEGPAETVFRGTFPY